MTIGVDGNEANVEKKVGVSVYTLELLKYFQKKSSEKLRFIIYLRKKPRSDMPNEANYFRYKTVWGPRLWRNIFFPIHLYLNKKINLLFSPAHYTPRFCPVPIVVTIHDLSYIFYPDEFLKKDLYKLTSWTKHAVLQAKKIIAVSNSTKKDIIKQYGIAGNKIQTIHNGFADEQPPVKKTSNILSRFNIRDSNFLLYVGTIQPRKNIETLIEAFSRILKNRTDLKLVIVGKRGWLYRQIFKKAADLGISKSVVFTDYLSDNEVVYLYKRALSFILPSIYEGFGMPILEAMNNNCPVIASNTSSLPEVGKDACLYFDPFDKIELERKIKKLIENEPLRKQLVDRGKQRVKDFSWEKCARETLELLKTNCK